MSITPYAIRWYHEQQRRRAAASAPPRQPEPRKPRPAGLEAPPRPGHWLSGAVLLALAAVAVGLAVLIATGAFHSARGAEAPAPWATGQKRQRMQTLNPLADYAADEAVEYFDDRTCPPAYQHDGGFHAPRYNISADPSEPHGNANREFPWKTAGGLDRVPADQAAGFKFLRLPTDARGRRVPIVWWQTSRRYRWAFPIGTTVGEILTMRCADGHWRPFEGRLRHRGPAGWHVEILRQHPTAADLAAAIQALRPDWASDPELRAAIDRLAQPAGPPEDFRDRRHPRPALTVAAVRVDVLPKLPADLQAALLDPARFPYQHATGQDWKPGCAAPTATPASGPGIVPVNYRAHLLGSDDHACAKCHDTVGKSTDAFDQPRDWYGLVRGDDAIFSWHPARPASISTNGFIWPVRLYDLPGQVEHLDRTRHDLARYGKLVPQ
ncbi:MAG: hypothetical protein K2Y37_14740 [Pirellulales bacterium]|nr:hypothetical protein [Pirellulales bacterium]